MKLKLLTSLSVLMFFMLFSCETTEEGGVIINNGSGGPVTVTVDGESYDLDIDDVQTITWDFTDDEDMDIAITAEGMFVMDYSTSKYIWGGELIDTEIWANATAVRIINATGASITEVYISPYTATTWGTNMIVSTIANGSQDDFTVEDGSYDLKIVDSNGTTYTKSWLDLPYFSNGVLQSITIGS